MSQTKGNPDFFFLLLVGRPFTKVYVLKKNKTNKNKHEMKKFTYTKVRWLFILLFFFVCKLPYVNAETITSINAGDWNTASNWSPEQVPGDGDDVIITYWMNLYSDAVCQNLSIEGSGRLSIVAGVKLTVNGSITMDGQGIEMASSTSSSSLLFNTISGNGTLKYSRYMTGTTTPPLIWHTISSPVEYGSPYSFRTQLYRNSNNIYAFGNYEESQNAWSYWSSVSNEFVLGKGYAMASRNSGGVTFDGFPATGNVSIQISHSSGNTEDEPYGGWGWNATGNPYTAALSVSRFYNTNRDKLDSRYGGLYVWNPLVQGYSVSTQATGGYIQVGQGFVVRSKTERETINFTYAMREHAPTAGFKSAKIGTDEPEVNEVSEIILHANSNGVDRNTVFIFKEGMTLGLDPYYDAGLLRSGGGLDLYSRLTEGDEIDMALQALPDSGLNNMVIPVFVELQNVGEVTFSAELNNVPEGCEPVLEDRVTGERTVLAQEGNSYSVNLPSTSSNVSDRFYLHMTNITTGTENMLQKSLDVYAIDKEINIAGKITQQSKAYLYNLTGNVIGMYDLNIGSQNIINANNVLPGIYLIRISEGNQQIYSGKVILK